jgi:Spy/CpxP family protein refolding chaperone
MRKLQLVLVAAMLVGGSAAATAQDPQPQGQRQGGGRGIGMLMQGITLTAEQQTKVDSINARYSTERRAIMQDESLDQDARRAKGRELMGKQRDEIKALLTDEQKKVFDKNVEDMQARMQQGGGRPPRK